MTDETGTETDTPAQAKLREVRELLVQAHDKAGEAMVLPGRPDGMLNYVFMLVQTVDITSQLLRDEWPWGEDE